jgi:para-nitrobenzyl esterase
MDCVLAHEWVRDNIASCGGDPADVMILGQSGRGSKVTHLLALLSLANIQRVAGKHAL